MNLEPRVLTAGQSHFVGFHDLTPWNAHTDELVCLKTGVLEDHIPTCRDEAEVVIINETDGSETSVGRTRAWNWQKAARQRWLPSLGRRVIAFNASNASGFECHLLDVDTNTTRVLPLPLYDICDEHGFGLTLNFRRLAHCQPGYGYDHPSPEATFDYESDGVFRVDLQTGETRLILSLAEFLRTNRFDPALGENYFTHIQISPDGRRFVFMHRCSLPSGGLVNSFVVANSDGTDARILLDDKMSHFDWRDNDYVVIWCRKNTAIKKLKESKLLKVARVLYRVSRKIRLKAVRQGLYNESFRQLDVNDGSSVPVGKGVLTEDGHPQINPLQPMLWINDTYPNSEHMQTLMLYNQKTNQRLDLLRLVTEPTLQETGWRCDFHPRWHPKDERVCFDSAHLGRRQLCTLDVRGEIGKLVT